MLDASRLSALPVQLLGMLEASFDGVAVYKDRRIAAASASLAQMLGRDPRGERLLAAGTGLRAPSGGWDLRWIGAMSGPDGAPIRVEVFGMSATWDAHPAFVMAVRRLGDESGQADRLADEARKLEITQLLTADLSNHLNNELGALLGNLELVLERALGPEERSLIREAHAATLSASGRIGQLHILAGRAHLIRETTELDVALRRMAPADLRLDLTLGRTRVDLDAARMKEVLEALQSNAIQAGAHTVTLSTRIRQGRACVEVEDDGAGMPAAILSRATEPFFTNRKGQRGLGLSIAKSIAQGHAGELEVLSEEGRGTRVRLWLPVVDSPVSSPSGRLSILVVDDEENIRSVCRRALEDAGHRVLLAPSGERALELLEGIDLVLMDISMPGMTGVQLAQEARVRRPSLPMLAMTGYAEPGARDILEGLGIRIMAKPWRIKTLMDEVERAVGDP